MQLNQLWVVVIRLTVDMLLVKNKKIRIKKQTLNIFILGVFMFLNMEEFIYDVSKS